MDFPTLLHPRREPADQREGHRPRQRAHRLQETGDLGRTPEPESMYDSDMAVYLGGRTKKARQPNQTEQNIELMKRWAREGR